MADSNTTATELDAMFDAFEAIDGIARAMLAGDDDPIPLAKGIKHIAGEMLHVVDGYREKMAGQIKQPSA